MKSKKRGNRIFLPLSLGILLIGLALALGWWQARSRAAGQRTPVERVLMEFLTPSLRAGKVVRDATQIVNPNDTSGADKLPPTVNTRLAELEEENRRLTQLLALQSTLPAGAQAVEVIGAGFIPGQGFIILGKGGKDGLEAGMAAVTTDGVVGQVVSVTPSTAEVLPLNDSASGIGAITTRTRVTGVLKGYRGGLCQLEYLSVDADVKEGDELVTSGLGRHFPKGYPLGRVISVSKDPARSALVAIVQPGVEITKVDGVVVFK